MQLDLELEPDPEPVPAVPSSAVPSLSSDPRDVIHADGLNRYVSWYESPKPISDNISTILNEKESFIAMVEGAGNKTLVTSCITHAVSQKGRALWQETTGDPALRVGTGKVLVVVDSEYTANKMLEYLTKQKLSVSWEKGNKTADFSADIVITTPDSMIRERTKKGVVDNRILDFKNDALKNNWDPDLVVCFNAASRENTDTRLNNILQNFPKAKTLNSSKSLEGGASFANLGTPIAMVNMQDAISRGVVPDYTKVMQDIELYKVVGGKKISKALHACRTTAEKSRELDNPLVIEQIASCIMHEMGFAAKQPAVTSKKALVFAKSKQHGSKILEALVTSGGVKIQFPLPVPALARPRIAEIYAETANRDEILTAYATGEIDVIINHVCLLENFRDTKVDFLVDLKPSADAVLVEAMLSKGLQTDAPGTKPTIKVWRPAEHPTTIGNPAKHAELLPNEQELADFTKKHGRGSTMLVILSWFKSSAALSAGIRPVPSLFDLSAGDMMKVLKPGLEKNLLSADYAGFVSQLEDVIRLRPDAPEDRSGGKRFGAAMYMHGPIENGMEQLIQMAKAQGYVYCPRGGVPSSTASGGGAGTSGAASVSSSSASLVLSKCPYLRYQVAELFSGKLLGAANTAKFCALMPATNIGGRLVPPSYMCRPFDVEPSDVPDNFTFVRDEHFNNGSVYVVMVDNPKTGEPDVLTVSFDRSATPAAVTINKPTLRVSAHIRGDDNKAVKNTDLSAFDQTVDPDSSEAKIFERVVGLDKDQIRQFKVTRATAHALMAYEYSEMNSVRNPEQMSDLEIIKRALIALSASGGVIDKNAFGGALPEVVSAKEKTHNRWKLKITPKVPPVEV